MRHPSSILLLVAILLSGACTHLPARTERDQKQPRTIATSIDRITDDAVHRGEVAASTLELHEGDDPASPDDDFAVGFVEFDDQGWFHNEAQFATVKREVEALLLPQGGPSHPAILVGFIHGWRHSAAVCDRDVTCFREVLRGLSVYEAERAAICAKYLGD